MNVVVDRWQTSVTLLSKELACEYIHMFVTKNDFG